MTATLLSVDKLLPREIKTRSELLVSLSRLMALISGVVGIAHIVAWFVQPKPWEVLAILVLASTLAISLGSFGLARSDRIDAGAYLLVAGLALVILLADAVVGGLVVMAPAQTVPIVLAGLLLPRRAVLGVAGVVTAVFLAQVAQGDAAPSLVPLVAGDVPAVNFVVTLGSFLVLSVVASEYSVRLGSALAQSEGRARIAEQHAAELEEAKAELERRMVELAAAKQEIEVKRELGVAVSSEIRGMGRELAATSSQQASGASEQAAAMSEIVATMEELSRAASQIAGNSAQVSQLAATALHGAQVGREAVDETIAGLDRIRAEVRGVAEKNLTLGQKTQAIGEIIEVITEIADRTHLLALNAAIESAAAGEYGRRFSVVASQVKELANEAKSAAHQVRVAVAEIQRAASATVLAAEKSEGHVEAGAGLGHGARDAMTGIVEVVQDMAGAAKEMLLATQQQQSASEQVVNTVRDIEQVTRQTAEGSRQLSQAVSQLMNTAERLQ